MTRTKNPAFARDGFTLIEMLVVLGIIAVLIGLLFPVYLMVRQAGYAVSTAQEINVISAAITRYYSELGAYPGPFSNKDIEDGNIHLTGDSSGNAVTMPENLVLGLEGGVTIQGTTAFFNPAQVGAGPLNLNTNTVAAGFRYAPFVDANMGTNLMTNLNNTSVGAGPGRFITGLTAGVAIPGQNEAFDTDVPEFVDRFPDALPILYLRSRVGAMGGIISNVDPNPPAQPPMQYDIRDILPYTTTTIGVGNPVHGLQGLWVTGGSPNINGGTASVQSIHGDFPNNALWYFQDQNVATKPNAGPAVIQTTGTARSYNQFILIAAGRDRLWGTHYDITSFGDVTQ